MQKRELMILAYLRENARQTLTNISRRTNTPVSTIYEKLKQGFDGLLKRNVALLDFSVLGYNIRANIMVSCAREHRDILKDFLQKHFQVNSFYKVNNGFDYLIEAIFKDMADVEAFVDRLEQLHVLSKQVNYIIQEFKRESFLSDPKLVEIMFSKI